MTQMNRHTVVVLATVVLAAGRIPAQEPQEPAVTFRSAIEAIEIDAYVTDGQGNPVSGLTADDFELIEDGQPQPITTFTAVDIPIDGPGHLPSRIAEPDVQSNNGPQGRIYLFALDEVHGANILRTRRFLRTFIETYFGPNDIGAVALVGRGLATSGQDFTSNRRLLLEAVDTFGGGFGTEGVAAGRARPLPPSMAEPCRPGREPGDIRTSGRSQQLASLRSLTELMTRMGGRHKALLFFTECVSVDATDLVDYNGGTLGLAGDDAHAAMAAATRSNLAIYPIDPTGADAQRVPLTTISAFRALADATGGVALINSNSFTETFERIVRDNSTYYMLGFNSAYHEADGKYVRLDLRVKRPGLTVRTRGGYVAPTRAERRAQEAVARRRRNHAVPPAASLALASPVTTDGLPLHVTAIARHAQEDEARVTLVVELDAATPGLRLERGDDRGTVDLSYLLTDARRRVYSEVRHTASIPADAESDAPLTAHGGRVRILTELQLPEGRYQIRVGASAGGRVGGVVYDLEIPDFGDDDLAVSGLALSTPAERGVLTLEAEQRNGRLKTTTCYSERCASSITDGGALRVRAAPGSGTTTASPVSAPPTTAREFLAADHVVVSAEVYENVRRRRGAPAHTMAAHVSLRAADGRVMPLTQAELPSTAPRAASGGHVVALRLPLADTPPGPYALRLEVTTDRGDARSVIREIPIRVK